MHRSSQLHGMGRNMPVFLASKASSSSCQVYILPHLERGAVASAACRSAHVSPCHDWPSSCAVVVGCGWAFVYSPTIRSSLSSILRRWCSGLNTVGIFLTFLFVPEPLRVPLAELDRRYAYSSAGKVYHGAYLLCWSGRLTRIDHLH